MLPRRGFPHLLLAVLSSFIVDYIVRQKTSGTHLKYFTMKQIPVPGPEVFLKPSPWLGLPESANWIGARALELSFTAYDMAPFAAEVGDDGTPFRWDDERRFRMRAELDAAFFHMYGIERGDVDYIMDSFVAFQNNDRVRFDRTKGLILKVYDAMAEAARTGRSYQTILDPSPGQGTRHG
jgi:hypothetical protein